jgi:hypothetical protein
MKINNLLENSIKKSNHLIYSEESDPRSSNLIPEKTSRSPKSRLTSKPENENIYSFQKGVFKKYLSNKYKKDPRNVQTERKMNKNIFNVKKPIIQNFTNVKPKNQKIENIYKFTKSRENKSINHIYGKLTQNVLYQTNQTQSTDTEKGEVLFIIKFNVSNKNIIVKYHETSNAFNLSEKLAKKYKLSDKKREDVYNLILTRLREYKELMEDSKNDINDNKDPHLHTTE